MRVTVHGTPFSSAATSILRRNGIYRNASKSCHDKIQWATLMSEESGVARGALSPNSKTATTPRSHRFGGPWRVFLAFSADAARAAGLTAQQHQAILRHSRLGVGRRDDDQRSG